MNNRLIPTLFVFGYGVALAVLGVLFVTKPDKVVEYYRRGHLRSRRFMQKWPLANLVMKPWMPTYFRFMGLFVLAFALVLLYLGFLANSK